MSVKNIIIVLCILAIGGLLVVGGIAGVLFNYSFVDYKEGDLSAGEEIFKYETNPLTVDTDGDGLNDYQEIEVYNSDPHNKHSDNDSLADGKEIEIGGDPTKEDTDGDGLEDDREYELNTDLNNSNTDDDYLTDYEEVIEYQTNPTNPDTSGDGFKDGLLDEANEEYPELYDSDLNPNKRHIFLYVSRTEGASIPKEELQYIEQLFENSSVKYNGYEGIEMHIVYNDTSVESDGDMGYYEFRKMHQEMTIDNIGFHHVAIVNEIDIESENNVIGITRTNAQLMLVKDRHSDTVYGNTYHTGETILHELGHSLGLTNTDFNGIDTNKYSHEEYPSVLNYDYKSNRRYNYSSGASFDDWNYIEENMYEANTEKLEKNIDK
jgi:hypothetical protein